MAEHKNSLVQPKGQPRKCVLRKVLRGAFKDLTLEKLYQSYSIKQKRAGLECFLFTAILFDVYMLVVPSGQDLLVFGVMSAFLTVNCCLLIWCKRGVQKCAIWPAVPHICWHLANAQLLASLFLKKNEVTSRDSLGWVLLLEYLIYVTLPLRFRYCVILSIATCASYLATIIGLSKMEYHLIRQHLTNCLLLLTANVLGITAYFIEENQQRRAFLETRKSLEVKLVIEEQSDEQERLLLSVLPEHVAVQMRQDLDSADSQFKKIYMSRHENVSILYADIVGFTAISSTYSAQELVKMLNELFARFDKLAEKYHQLRIKILGDCYYCISGAPQERPDHAVLCVHMGLSMVKAIKYVQQTTNSPVDMRVGIHTGAVLAGVLGQRQWQFDVYSKDVELANKMESSGMAGRVHISATTLSFLSGEFEVEPAFGEKREESLRIAGLKTFFIGKVLKPFQSDVKQEVQNGAGIIHEEDSCVIGDLGSDTTKDGDDGEDCQAHPLRQRQDSEDFKMRLRKELMNRDGHRELGKSTHFLSLTYNNPELEKGYHSYTESFINVTSFLFVFVSLFISIAYAFVFPIRRLLFIVNPVGILCCQLLAFAGLFGSRPVKFGRFQTSFDYVKKSMWWRRFLSLLGIFILASINILDTIACAPPSQPQNCTIVDDIEANCMYPSYFSYSAVLILIAAALPASLSYTWKTILMILITIAHCCSNVLTLDLVLLCEESRKHFANLTQEKYTLSALLLVATVALAFLARHMEQVSRVLFLWRNEVEKQRECASDMRRRNEALVYNILPPHVAEHFMGNRKRQHDELYSQSYADVGVLFASMPNFSDFYSEETVNNQGLECLRFLNEVISDFDALLELPQFQDIIKIKTIGSTYMAASGLNPTKHVKLEDPIKVRWAHLALLVEFALELKKALQCINEQSFNHFVLKLGINHGPITAGVIGARKPHYDIWGNTVNVASRMESTGKAGCIQVTEETSQILKNFGYQFEQRGLVAVKGKGNLMTYYLLGKAGKITPPTAPVSPVLGGAASGITQTAAADSSAAAAATAAGDESGSHDSHTSKSDDKTDKTVIECADARSDIVFSDADGIATQPLSALSNDDVCSRDMTENTLLLSDS